MRIQVSGKCTNQCCGASAPKLRLSRCAKSHQLHNAYDYGRGCTTGRQLHVALDSCTQLLRCSLNPNRLACMPAHSLAHMPATAWHTCLHTVWHMCLHTVWHTCLQYGTVCLHTVWHTCLPFLQHISIAHTPLPFLHESAACRVTCS